MVRSHSFDKNYNSTKLSLPLFGNKEKHWANKKEKHHINDKNKPRLGNCLFSSLTNKHN